MSKVKVRGNGATTLKRGQRKTIFSKRLNQRTFWRRFDGMMGLNRMKAQEKKE